MLPAFNYSAIQLFSYFNSARQGAIKNDAAAAFYGRPDKEVDLWPFTIICRYSRMCTNSRCGFFN